MHNSQMEMKMLGVRYMLMEAIKKHREQHRREYPKKIVLHPAVLKDLRRNSELLDFDFPSGLSSEKFQGVPIESDVLATRAKIITIDNVVEYL
jgi:hypothetical protein